MSLRVAVAAPFKRNGRTRMREQAFVVDLAIDRNWVSPDQAKKLADLAKRRGLVEHHDGELEATFDLDSVTVPDGFVPDETIFQQRAPFEDILDQLVAAGHERQPTVAGINTLQDKLLVNADTAAVLYARRKGVDVADAAARTAAGLRQQR